MTDQMDPFARLLAWRASDPDRDITLLTIGHNWTCRLWERGRLVAHQQGRTHAVAIVAALEAYTQAEASR